MLALDTVNIQHFNSLLGKLREFLDFFVVIRRSTSEPEEPVQETATGLLIGVLIPTSIPFFILAVGREREPESTVKTPFSVSFRGEA